MKQRFLFLVLLLCLLASSVQAQVSIKNMGVGMSYWNPSLDYWNERSLLSAYNYNEGASFRGGLMPTGQLEARLYKNLSAVARLGYLKQSVSGNLRVAGIERTEQLSVALIPVSFNAVYQFTSGDSSLLPRLYAGAGFTKYYITNQLERRVVDNEGSLSETQTGNNQGFNLLLGGEKTIYGPLAVAVELRYHLGRYNQQVAGGEPADVSVEKVSLNGLEAGVSLRFKLGR
jgi:opacity protein-like surface antigen